MGNSFAIFASVKLLGNFMAIYRQKPITVIPENFYCNYPKNSLSWEFGMSVYNMVSYDCFCLC